MEEKNDNDQKEFTTINWKVIHQRNKLLKKYKIIKEKLDPDNLLNLKKLYLNNFVPPIRDIENIEIFTKLTHLYLQENKIEEISNELEFMDQLKVLNLSNNCIKKIENLNHLSSLEYLNLKENTIENFEQTQIPSKNLIVLNLNGNPFLEKLKENEKKELRSKLIQQCPKLLELNGKAIQERMKTYDIKKTIEELKSTYEDRFSPRERVTKVKNRKFGKYDEILHSFQKKEQRNSNDRGKFYSELNEESKKLQEKMFDDLNLKMEAIDSSFKHHTNTIKNKSLTKRKTDIEGLKQRLNKRIKELDNGSIELAKKLRTHRSTNLETKFVTKIDNEINEE